MFVRFRRQSENRLQVSLVAGYRVDGRVRTEHIAGLGSIAASPSVADRIAFWAALHERLAKLSNRIDAEAQAKILGAIHARAPMPTPDEQRAVQLDNAKADAVLWDGLRDLHASTAADHKGLIAGAERRVAAAQVEASKAAAAADAAKERVERIEKGEDVQGGLSKPLDVDATLAKAGWTKRDLRHAALLGLLPESELEGLLDRVMKHTKLAERRATRTYVREYLLARLGE